MSLIILESVSGEGFLSFYDPFKFFPSKYEGRSLQIDGFIKGEDGQLLIATLRNASISSILFGVLYSEFLGFACPWKPILFARHLNIGAHATGHGPMIPELMVMAAWIGIFHITLGRAIGMANHARQDHGSHRVKAVMANAGWLCVLWGILLLIWSMFPMPLMPDLTGMPAIVLGLNAAAIVGMAAMIAGVIFIARESALEIVELPTIFSHSLSYSRLVAVGLSSVAIAMVVNYIAIGMLIEPQLENITLISVGHWLESRVSVRASSALRKLLNLAPATARRRHPEGGETEMPVAELRPGDEVVLRPGDRIPTDGVVWRDSRRWTSQCLPVKVSREK
jgi:hypothetical protein